MTSSDAGRTRDPAQSRSVEQLAALRASGERPRYLFFWGHTAAPAGASGPWFLSQWWPHRFSADGETFGSAEHYMMWRKALLFGDDERAGAVLGAASPAAAKAIGRQVAGFDESVWKAHRRDIVVEGSTAKFGSDPALRDYLLGTRNRVLVEASPRDRIWGIGLSADSPGVEDPRRWKGLNLLGFALMEARDRLAP